MHLVNKRWLDKLPKDLQEVFLSVIKEESEKSRALTRKQHEDQVAAAKEAGVEFHTLSDTDMAKIKEMSEPVLQNWSQKIGPEYVATVRAALAK